MTWLLLLLILIAFLAALGRSAIPRAERLPLSIWSWSDLIVNVVRGARVLSEANEGQRLLWERHHDEVQSHDHRPDDYGERGRKGEDER